MYLHDNLWVGSILFGYAIESIFKDAALFLGNTNKKVQNSHDLKFLFKSCRSKGAFTNVEVPEDFLDFANSLFQMRYPSIEISETLKAYAKDKTISVNKHYLFCYDDFFHQLDEEFFKLSHEPYSSTILRIFAGLSEGKRHLGLYFNSEVLKNYDLYKERMNKYFPLNKAALKLLNDNNAEYFWTDGHNYSIYADLNHYANNRELPKFVFPGKVVRDKNGNILQLHF